MNKDILINMSFTKTVVFIILVCYTFGGNCCNRKFTPISEYKECEYIKRDFPKLEGKWYSLARRISERAPAIHFGSLDVFAATPNSFTSELKYNTKRGWTRYLHLVGTYQNDTTVKITGWKKEPYYAEVGICNSGTVFRVIPLIQDGYTMIFTRHKYSLKNVGDYIDIDYYSDTVLEIPA